MKILRPVLSLASLLYFALAANAAPLPNPISLGVHAGTGILGDGGGAQIDLGVDGSYDLSAPFFVAAGFSWINQGNIQSSTVNTSGSLYLLDGSMNLDTSGIVPDTFAGLAIGLQFNHTSVSAGTINASTTDTSLIVGPRIGYDYALSSSFTIGGEGDLFITTGSNSPNVLQLIAVLKLWL